MSAPLLPEAHCLIAHALESISIEELETSNEQAAVCANKVQKSRYSDTPLIVSLDSSRNRLKISISDLEAANRKILRTL